ncbi:MAG: HPr family phosphocarrier protein [Bacillota bacterium]
MYSVEILVKNPTGLHARPAQQLVKLCSAFKSDIKIITAQKSIDPKSIFSVLSGAVKQGTKVTVQAEGEDEQKAVDAIVEYIKELNE